MKWLLLSLLLLPIGANAQNIIVIAGGGHTIGDGSSATAAQINDPGQMAFDKLGNLYIAEGNGNRVRKISTSGIITTVAGTTGGYSGDNGPATAAKLNFAAGVVLDTSGNIFIADANNNVIRRVDAVTGIITTICGNSTHGYTGDGGPATAAQLFTPNAVSFDHVGNLYIADVTNQVIRKINTSGIITTFAGTGVQGYNGDDISATSAQLNDPLDMQADDSGNIYISDAGNVRVRRVNTTGTITTYAGNGTYTYSGDNVPATAADFESNYMTFDSAQNLYISDEVNGRVYVIYHATGIFHTMAGDGHDYNAGIGGPATAASFSNFPDGVAVDACGNLYINNVSDYADSDYVWKVLLNPIGLPSISITASPSDTVCKEMVTYTAIVSYGAAISYQWYVDGTFTGATSNSYSYTPVNGDSISCVLTGVSQCSGDTVTVSSNTIYMVVNAPTTPTITLSATTPALVGSTVTVNATIANAGSSYNINWYDNDMLFNTTTAPVVTYIKDTGTDNITATVIPIGGCYDSTTSSVFSIGATTAINNIAISPLNIYPNPAHDVLHIDNLTQQTTYILLTTIGTTLQTGTLHPGNNALPTQSFPPGIYLLELTTPTTPKTITKILKL